MSWLALLGAIPPLVLFVAICRAMDEIDSKRADRDHRQTRY